MGLQVSAVHKMLANVELELQAERLGLMQMWREMPLEG